MDLRRHEKYMKLLNCADCGQSSDMKEMIKDGEKFRCSECDKKFKNSKAKNPPYANSTEQDIACLAQEDKTRRENVIKDTQTPARTLLLVNVVTKIVCTCMQHLFVPSF